MKAGTLTQDEAKTELNALGVKAPVGHPLQGPFANLDNATKAKVQAIFDQERAGTITKENVKTQLEALGIKAPSHDFGKNPDSLKN